MWPIVEFLLRQAMGIRWGNQADVSGEEEELTIMAPCRTAMRSFFRSLLISLLTVSGEMPISSDSSICRSASMRAICLLHGDLCGLERSMIVLYSFVSAHSPEMASRICSLLCNSSFRIVVNLHRTSALARTKLEKRCRLME